MPELKGLDWALCDSGGCTGVRLGESLRCLAHATDEERDVALKRLDETGKIDARGVRITSALLEQVLAAAPRTSAGYPVFTEALFQQAIFEGDAQFAQATFYGDAVFNGTTFEGQARFAKAIFNDAAGFNRATFEGDAAFGSAVFKGRAAFTFANFKRGAWFPEATFQDWVAFRTTFEGDTTFNGATFERAGLFGPLLAHRGLGLDDVRFAQPVQIRASTIGVCCRRAQFLGGVQFRLSYARVLLDDTDMARPSLLIGVPSRDQPELREGGRTSARPQLLSLRRANVAGLALANIDLADCRFVGAHNLDKLRLEADVTFAVSPHRPQWSRRQVIAEERMWRVDHSNRSGKWTPPWWPDHAYDEKWLRSAIDNPPGVEDAGTIASMYRALRKGREDTKNEPGAADFYYGEMEMRRHPSMQGVGGTDGAARGRMERGLLTSYWLVSGYGLRAWRALAWLAGLTAAFAAAFHLIGFTRPPQPGHILDQLVVFVPCHYLANR